LLQGILIHLSIQSGSFEKKNDNYYEQIYRNLFLITFNFEKK